MIRTDEQGNLYTLLGNSATFSIKDIPEKSGTLVCCFNGDVEVKKEYPLTGQQEAIVKLSRQDIEDIGAGQHTYYIDIVSNNGDDVDTLVYQNIYVYEKE